MELKGKTVAFLGDSITEGHSTTAPEKNYVSVFERLSGANVLNYGVGGTRIARRTAASELEGMDEDFILRADKMETGADAVVVFGGTNDFGHGDAAIGSFEDDTEYTFYGALHILCRKLINKYPEALIVFVTPLHRLNEKRIITENVIELKTYVNAVKEVAQYYSLPVLDLYSLSGMQPTVDVLRERYMPDGLHPSDAGAEIIAKRLVGFFSVL